MNENLPGRIAILTTSICAESTILRARETATMGEVSRIDLKLERKPFNIVLGTFSFMRDNYCNPAIIDPAALFISQQEVAEIVNKLRISDTVCNEITIR